jgi:hypothetical protein
VAPAAGALARETDGIVRTLLGREIKRLRRSWGRRRRSAGRRRVSACAAIVRARPGVSSSATCA